MKSTRLAVTAAAALALTAALVPAVSASARPTARSGVARWGAFAAATSTGGGKTDVPVAITGIPAHVVQVATSNTAGYALTSTGSVYAWGRGQYGQLGDGTIANSLNAAVQVKFPPGVRIASLPQDTMPYDTAVAVATNGIVYGWGDNNAGQLCLGNTRRRLTPVALPALAGATSIGGAGNHLTFISAGVAWSCGSGKSGALGTGSANASLRPARVALPAGQRPVAAVASFQNGAVLTASGRVYTWGLDSSGQLGDGSIAPYSATPVRVTFLGDVFPVVQVSMGGSLGTNGQSFAQLADGMWWAWGNDTWSQLGDGATEAQATPVPLVPPANVTWTQVVSAGSSAYGLDSSGNLWAWGDGADGAVGDGSYGNATSPVEVAQGVTGVSATANDVAAAAQSVRQAPEEDRGEAGRPGASADRSPRSQTGSHSQWV